MSAAQDLKDKMSTACAILQRELANMWGHESATAESGFNPRVVVFAKCGICRDDHTP